MNTMQVLAIWKSCRLALAVFVSIPSLVVTISAAYEGPVVQPEDAYGGQGDFSVIEYTIPSPKWLGQEVAVYLPQGLDTPVPVWFFSHGFGGTKPEYYEELLLHLSQHGYAVVFSPYPPNLRAEENYDIVFAGFAKAVEMYSEFIDTSRVGFAGHSYGAGAVPALALSGIREQGWGSEALALYLMAPWYSFSVSDEDLASFPDYTQAIVQIYDADTINDHRMAVEIYRALDIPEHSKSFLAIVSDEIGGYLYDSNHNVPTGPGTPRDGSVYNALDSWGVHRMIAALSESAFNNSSEAQSIAFGDGSTNEIEMGSTIGGETLTPMIRVRHPEALYPMNKYLQPYSGNLNPRKTGKRTSLYLDHFSYEQGSELAGSFWNVTSGSFSISDRSLDARDVGLQNPAGFALELGSDKSAKASLDFVSGAIGGKLYTSFLVKASEGLASDAKLLALSPSGANNEIITIWAKPPFQLGVSLAGSEIAWAGVELTDYGPPTLVVCEFAFATAGADYTLKLWVDPSLTPESPPASASAALTASSLSIPNGIGRVSLFGGSKVVFDELRISLEWTTALPYDTPLDLRSQLILNEDQILELQTSGGPPGTLATIEQAAASTPLTWSSYLERRFDDGGTFSAILDLSASIRFWRVSIDSIPFLGY